MTASLFIPCLVDLFFPETGIATVKVLERLGVRVIYPSEQTCCGQPAFNTGYRREATRLAVRFVRIFRDAEYIVAPSGSCVSMVKMFPELDIPASLHEDAAHVSSHIYELSEFLVNVLKTEDVGAAFPHTVTYHESCHLRRELGVIDEPRRLLKHVRGLSLVEMENADLCCGFGGTFAVKFPLLSTAMGEQKVRSITAANVEYVTAGDSGCLLQIGGLLSRHGIRTQPIHIAEILSSD